MNTYYIALNDCKYIDKLFKSLILNVDNKYIIKNNLDPNKMSNVLKLLLKNITIFMCGIDKESSKEDIKFLLDSSLFWTKETVNEHVMFSILSTTIKDIKSNEKDTIKKFFEKYGVSYNRVSPVWSIIFDLVDNSSNFILSLRTLVVIYSLIEHYLIQIMSLDNNNSNYEKNFITEFTIGIKRAMIGRWPEYFSNFDFNKILSEITSLYNMSDDTIFNKHANILDPIYVRYINNPALLKKYMPYNKNESDNTNDSTVYLLRKENLTYSSDTKDLLTDNDETTDIVSEDNSSTDNPDFIVTETLDELIHELNSLVGLENIKKDINDMINLIKVRNMRKENNLPITDMSLHLVFTGDPGTGKTTIARLIAKIYNKLGVVSKGQLIETDRAGLISGYVGQTAIKVKEKVEEALGGVLFIDEAYTLTQDDSNDFSDEAIATLLKYMEDYRNDLVVIVAGYTDLMKDFISSNPGLKSRFNKYLEFSDYTINQLKDIFLLLCKKNEYSLQKELENTLIENIQKQINNNKEDFGNARGVRNYFEKVLVNQANRLVNLDSQNVTKKDLKEIIEEDLHI